MGELVERAESWGECLNEPKEVGGGEPEEEEPVESFDASK